MGRAVAGAGADCATCVLRIVGATDNRLNPAASACPTVRTSVDCVGGRGGRRRESRFRCEERVKNATRGGGRVRSSQPVGAAASHWARFRREGGSLAVRIPAANHLKSYRTARSAFPAVIMNEEGGAGKSSAPPSVLPRSPNRQAGSRQDATNVTLGHHRSIIGANSVTMESRAECLVYRGNPAEAPGRSRNGSPRQCPRSRRRGEGWRATDGAEKTGGERRPTRRWTGPRMPAAASAPMAR